MPRTIERYTTTGDETVEKRVDAGGREYHVRVGEGRISEAAYRGLQSQRVEDEPVSMRAHASVPRTNPDTGRTDRLAVQSHEDAQGLGELVENRRRPDSLDVSDYVEGDDVTLGEVRSAVAEFSDPGFDIFHYE